MTLRSPWQVEQFASAINRSTYLAEATSVLKLRVDVKDMVDAELTEAYAIAPQCRCCLLWAPWHATFDCIRQAFSLLNPYFLHVHVDCPCIVHTTIGSLGTRRLRMIGSIRRGTNREHSEAAANVLFQLYQRTVTTLWSLSATTAAQSESLWSMLIIAPVKALPAFEKLESYAGTLCDLLFDDASVSATIIDLCVYTTKWDARLQAFMTHNQAQGWSSLDLLHRLPQGITWLDIDSLRQPSDLEFCEMLLEGLCDAALFPKLQTITIADDSTLHAAANESVYLNLKQICAYRSINFLLRI